MGHNGKKLTSPQAVNNAIWAACDILRRSNAAGAMQYVPELTWLLFLRILDEREEQEAERAEAVGGSFVPSLGYPYRWSDWAAPDGKKRAEFGQGELGKAKTFVNDDLLPYLKQFSLSETATPRQRMVSEIMVGVERTRVDTDKNLLDVLDKVHEIREGTIDAQHMFHISQAYEGLLLRMGEKNNDGGQFFTPREVIRAVVQVIAPQADETIYDPACGTGGFLAEAYEFIQQNQGDTLTTEQIETLKHDTFFGREKENLIYPIALANLVLHGIEQPHIWHGNTLTRTEVYGGLFTGAPDLFDVILTNPPFGGKENKAAQTRFTFKTSATQVLFILEVINSLKKDGRCGIVLDEGVLFRTNEMAFVQTKRKLLDECKVWCILSLPAGTFIGAGGGVKTNLLFFTRGEPTEDIWYYDLSERKVTKRNPLTLADFDEFFALLPDRADSPHSWTINIQAKRTAAKAKSDPLRLEAVSLRHEVADLESQLKTLKKNKDTDPAELQMVEESLKDLRKRISELENKAQAIEDAVYDLKAVNPNVVAATNTRTVKELLDIIEEKGKEVNAALERLRRWYQ